MSEWCDLCGRHMNDPHTGVCVLINEIAKKDMPSAISLAQALPRGAYV